MHAEERGKEQSNARPPVLVIPKLYLRNKSSQTPKHYIQFANIVKLSKKSLRQKERLKLTSSRVTDGMSFHM